MPTFDTKPKKFKPGKDIVEEWTNFRKGLNLLLRTTELDNDEAAVLDNLQLTGSGVPTGRPGTTTYFTANATGSIRGLGEYKSNDGTTNDLLALTDQGYVVKRNGSSSTTIVGQSYPSGSVIRTTQLGGKTYIASKDVAFTEYDGTDLSVYATISSPTGLSATNFSGATGPNSESYRVTAVGPNGGTTLGSDNYVISELPNDLTQTQVHLFWSAPSAATLSGYEIYRGFPGNEKWLAAVPTTETKYIDNGSETAVSQLPPLVNTTGGIKSPIIVRYKDRLLAVSADEPSLMLISAKYPDHTKFDILSGGGSVYIEPDSGDNIKGVAVQPIADKIVVYKERSSHLVSIEQQQIGNFFLLDPQYSAISNSVGCSSQDTIQTVENDTFYFGRDGLYVTGYEPNFLNIIRTNEVSARIRPYLELLGQDDYDTACAMYVDNKYILSFPIRKEMIVYDRERGSFTGPWKLPYGISHMMKYYDSDGTEKWVLGSRDDNTVYTFESGINTDDGTAITKTLRTGKVAFKDWTLLSIIRFFYILFKDVSGTVTVNIIIEDRDGDTSTVKSFTISGSEVSGSAGYGTDQYGTAKYGTTKSTSYSAISGEIRRWGSLFKQAALMQVEVTSTSAGSNFELLKIKATAKKQTQGSLSSSQRV